MFTAVKHLQRTKPKSQFLIKNDKGMLRSDQKEQANIIVNHFKKLFVIDAQNYPPITPPQMHSLFTAIEVTIAVHRMKNNKSPGQDQVNVELIKYAPIRVHQLIVGIYDEAATIGTYPVDLSEGLLTAV